MHINTSWIYERESPGAMRRLAPLTLVIAIVALMGACRSGSEDLAVRAPAGSPVSAASGSCPVTQAAEARFEPPSPYPERPPEGQFWHGDEALWTVLTSDGVWRDLPHHEHGYGQKLPWWRVGYDWQEEPLPALVVSGRRLDGESPEFTVTDATNGYHPDFESFMMTGFEFPSEGCWEITGRYEDSELSFVVLVEG